MALRRWLRRVKWAGAFVCPYALALGLRSPRRVRPLLSALVKAGLGFGGAKLQPLEPDRLLRCAEDVVLPASLFPGQHIEDYAWLARLAGAANPRAIFEIGTCLGASALVLAVNCPDATIHTLDLPDFPAQYLPHRHFKGRAEGERIVELFGDSTQFDFAPYEAQMDVVYVDGAHDWQTVESDTQAALQMARPGGLIIWDDYGRRGCDVTDYLEELDRKLGGRLRWVPETALVVYRVPQE